MNVLERLRQTRIVPILTLGVLLAPLVPSKAWAQSAPQAPPLQASAQINPASLGLPETTSAGVNGLASATVDPSSGVLHTQISFALPQARGAAQPRLGLTYSSSGAFGVGGRGWSLGMPSIERHNPSGMPLYNDPTLGAAVDPMNEDHFTFDGEPLVEICFIAAGGTCGVGTPGNQRQLMGGEQLPSFATQGGWHYYRLQTDKGDLARFFWSPDHLRWIVQQSNGETAEYGVPEGSATAPSVDRDSSVPANTSAAPGVNIFRWNLYTQYDTQRTAVSVPSNPIIYVWSTMAPSAGGTPLGYLTDVYDTPSLSAAAPSLESLASFAHHTNLTYVQPAWTPSTTTRLPLAAPAMLLSRVDVTSQDYAAAGARQQVRRYYLTYTSAAAETTDGPPAVQTVQLEGNCSGAGATSPPANNFESNGQLPAPSASQACPRMPVTTFTYAPVAFSSKTDTPALSPVNVYMPSTTSATSATGAPAPPLLFDLNNDGLPDLIDENAMSGSTPAPIAWINSATTAGQFVRYPISLAASTLDLTKISQLTPGPSSTTGAFAMDGHLDMLWSNWGQWQGVYPNAPGSGSGGAPPYPLAVCPDSSGMPYWCDPQLQYSFLAASFANGSFTLTPSAGGTFPVGAESPMLSTFYTKDYGNAALMFGPETPFAAMDMNGDGIADLVTSIFAEGEMPVPGLGENYLLPWHQFAVRFSKRSFDGTYWPFYGSASSADVVPARTDICVGGLNPSIQDQDTATFADIDGDGITDFAQLGPVTSPFYSACTNPMPGGYCPAQAIWWRGHGDGIFGVCADHTTNCACADAAPEILLPAGVIPVTQGPPSCQICQPPAPTFPFAAVHDVTGDGLADFLLATPGGFALYVNEGGPAVTFAPPQQVSAIFNSFGMATPSALFFADMDGSGVDDVIVQTPPMVANGPAGLGYVDLLGDDFSTSSLQVAVRPGLLSGIDNGLGLTTQVTYQSSVELAREAAASGQPWTMLSPQPLHVVTSVTLSDGAATYKTTYTYFNPVFDGHDNRFLGFQKVRQTSPGDAYTLVNTDTTYFYGACGAEIGVACASGIDYPAASYRGLPTLTEISNGVTAGAQFLSPTYLSTTHHSYATYLIYHGSDGRGARRVYESQTDSFLYDTAAFAESLYIAPIPDVDLPGYPVGVRVRGIQAHHLQRTATLDSFGHVASVVDSGDIGDTSLTAPDPAVLHTTSWFVPPATDVTNHWIWRPQVVTTGASISDPWSHSTTYGYDAHGNVTDVTRTLVGTAPMYRPTTGAPSPSTRSQDGAAHVAHIDYDPLGSGNPVDVQAFPSSTTASTVARCTEYSYDPAYHQLPTTEIADVGGCGSAQKMATTHSYDRVLGVEIGTVSPGNEVSARAYDGFGRLVSIAKPDPTNVGFADAPSTTIQYTEYPAANYGELIHVSQAAGLAYPGYPATDAYLYKDALGRTIQVVSPGDQAGQWVVSGQTIRDQRGRPTVSFVPHFVTATDGSTLYSSTAPPIAGTGTSYDAFNRVTQTMDIDGTVTSAMKYHALSVESRDGAQASGSGPHAAAYVLATRDGHGRTTRVDNYGNGGDVTTVSTYLATGELTSVTRSGADVNGAVNYARTMGYDTLGRMVTNSEPNTASSASGEVSWRYAYDDLGDLVGTSDARGCGENLAYDGAGRLLSEDYSPCSATLQGAWTPPSTSAGSGDGTEAFYVYEGDGLQTGRVSDVYDRASHSHLTHDGRGRVITVTRQLALIGTPNSALASRYSTAVFAATTGYDDRDRIVSQTTGANVPDLDSTNATYAGLVSSYGPSTVVGSYSSRDVLQNVTSSYGPIVASTVVEADGRPDSVVYADPAETTIAYTYGDSRRRLTETKISRGAAFPTAHGTYVPPAAGALQPTQQTVLADDVISTTGGYDVANNPLQVDDARLVGEWPVGAAPVTTRQYVYDDSYRVTSATSTFPKGTDAYQAPIAETTATTSPSPLATGGNRVLNQAFKYDGLGNTVSSTDDAQTFFDRSLGTITNGGGGAGPNQLTSATIPTSASGHAGSLSATYDAAGNLVQLDVQRSGPCTSAAGCNQLFRYDWDEVGRLARARRFDFVGGEVCVGGLIHTCVPKPLPSNYVYPALPTSAANADVSYAYDAGGARVLRASTPAGEETTYSAEIFPSLRLNHAGWDTTSASYECTTDTEAVYLTLGGASYGRVVYNPSAPAIAGDLHVYLELTDVLGSTSAVVDKDTSELVERTTYLPYGALDSDYRPDRWQDFREDYKFTGKEDDVEVGLTYFGARYYSAQLGRWVSADPLAIHALQADMNPYAYVRGRPLTHTDPQGLDDDDSDASTELGGTVNGQPVPGLGGTITATPSPVGPTAAAQDPGPTNTAPPPLDPFAEVGPTPCQAMSCHTEVDPHPWTKRDTMRMVEAVLTLPVTTFFGPENTANAVGPGEQGRPSTTSGDMALWAVATVATGVAGRLGNVILREEATTASSYVYRLVDESGSAVYYGISNDPVRRVAEHAAEGAFPFNGLQVISDAQPLAQARALESSLIQQAISDGRTIYNVAPNSISPLIPIQTPAAVTPTQTLLNPKWY